MFVVCNPNHSMHSMVLGAGEDQNSRSVTLGELGAILRGAKNASSSRCPLS